MSTSPEKDATEMPPKGNGLTTPHSQPVKNLTKLGVNFNARSTDTVTQTQRFLGLTTASPHHTHELREVGITHPAGRIRDLEKGGYVFDALRVTTVDSDGYAHRDAATQPGQHTGRRYILIAFIQPTSYWLVINAHWLVTVLLGLVLGVLQ